MSDAIKDILERMTKGEQLAESLIVPGDYVLSTIAWKLNKIKKYVEDLDELNYEKKFFYESGYIQSLLHFLHYREISVDVLMEESGIQHLYSKRRALEKGIFNQKITREEAKGFIS